jgi:hypothetical protein
MNWMWFLEWGSLPRRPRPKTKPPVNYDPNGLWRDYFNIDISQKMKTPTTMEDRDLYDHNTKRR